MNKKLIALAIAATCMSTLAFADSHSHKGRMETCMKAALAKHPGEFLR